jgi:hypothetical protein
MKIVHKNEKERDKVFPIHSSNFIPSTISESWRGSFEAMRVGNFTLTVAQSFF